MDSQKADLTHTSLSGHLSAHSPGLAQKRPVQGLDKVRRLSSPRGDPKPPWAPAAILDMRRGGEKRHR